VRRVPLVSKSPIACSIDPLEQEVDMEQVKVELEDLESVPLAGMLVGRYLAFEGLRALSVWGATRASGVVPAERVVIVDQAVGGRARCLVREGFRDVGELNGFVAAYLDAAEWLDLSPVAPEGVATLVALAGREAELRPG
jgi:hypothetical protein